MSDRTAEYGAVPILVSAVVGFAVATLSIALLHREAVFFETLYRVEPTVEGRGVGADWVVGNTLPWLDALVALTHAADVIMGIFILVMVFLHWGAFRRLAGRMRRPGEGGRSEAVADGGHAAGDRTTRSGERSGERTGTERAGDGSGDGNGGDRR